MCFKCLASAKCSSRRLHGKQRCFARRSLFYRTTASLSWQIGVLEDLRPLRNFPCHRLPQLLGGAASRFHADLLESLLDVVVLQDPSDFGVQPGNPVFRGVPADVKKATQAPASKPG